MSGLGALLLVGALAVPTVGRAGPLQQAPGVNPIVAENQRPGDRAWQATNLPQDSATGIPPEETEGPETAGQAAEFWQPRPIEGYADRASVERGGTIGFYVSTAAPRFDLSISRMGWYAGQGGREVHAVRGLPGQVQPVPPPDPATGLIDANWRISYTLTVPQDWVSGVYLVRLRADTEAGDEGYILFVVRDDSQVADFVYKLPVNTYQAYNNWGGKSLYAFNSVGEPATKVSFDRPYALRGGAGHFFHWDYPMIRWLERQGYNVTYITDVDAHTDREYLLGRRALLTVGHDEYWSKEMRDSWEAARNAGYSIAFFSANNAYWQVRYEPSPRGFPQRVLVCYRQAHRDPLAGRDDSRLTILWRNPPVARPENTLIGILYEGMIPFERNYPFVIKAADHWVFAGTGAVPGQQWSPIVGYEYDRTLDNGHTPPGLVVLAESPVVDVAGKASVAQAVYYRQGGMVFAAGTTNWSWALDDYWQQGFLDPRLERTTRNILDAFRAGTPPDAATAPHSASPQPLLPAAAGAVALALGASLTLWWRRRGRAPAGW